MSATIAAIDPKADTGLDPKYIEFHNAQLAGRPTYPSLGVEGTRKALASFVKPADLTQIPAKFKDLALDTKAGQIPVTMITPRGTLPDDGWPVLLHLHSGGFLAGSRKSNLGDLAQWANEAQCAVIAVDYRLAPEHPFPAAVDDACHAYKWIVDSAEILDINPRRIALAGISAGGGLAAVVTHFVQLYNKEHGRDNRIPEPAFQVLVVPLLDMRKKGPEEHHPNYLKHKDSPSLDTETLNWFIDNYVPDETFRHDPRASPILHSVDMLKSQPQTLVIAAGADLLQVDAEIYACKLRDAGVDVDFKLYEGAPHWFLHLKDHTTDGQNCFNFIGQALKVAFVKAAIREKEKDEKEKIARESAPPTPRTPGTPKYY